MENYNILSDWNDSLVDRAENHHVISVNAKFTSIYQQNHKLCEEIKETRPKHVKTSEHAEKD